MHPGLDMSEYYTRLDRLCNKQRPSNRHLKRNLRETEVICRNPVSLANTRMKRDGCFGDQIRPCGNTISFLASLCLQQPTDMVSNRHLLF